VTNLSGLSTRWRRDAAPRRFSPQIATIGFVLVVCVALLALDTLWSWNGRAAALAAGQVEAENLARSVAQQADGTLRAADATILGLIERIAADGEAPDQLRRLLDVMMVRSARFPAPVTFSILDEGGGEVISNDPEAAPNELDRSTILDQIAHDDLEPRIGAPVPKPDGGWSISLSRRFNRPDGHVGGVVVAALDMDNFLKYYDRFNIGQDGTIVLARQDGTLLIRRPFDASLVGTNLANTPLFNAYLPSAPAGDRETTSAIDGIKRLLSYRRLEAYPLIAVAALAEDEVLANWRSETRNHAFVVGPLVLAIGLFGTWLAMQIGRRERAERAVASLAEDYRRLAENSPNLVVRQGADGVRRYVNEELEAQVEARTAELSELNRRLTERETALRESTALLQATFDAAPFAIAVVALDLSVLSWNRTAELILGYSAAEMVGRSLLNLGTPDEWSVPQERIKQVAAGMRLPAMEQRRRHRDGREIDINVAITPVFDADHHVCAAIYTAEDVTHRKAIEAQLHQAQKMEAIGNLTGGMAHDFNNLLGVIIGNLDILLTVRPDDGEVGSLAGDALTAALRGAELTKRLLAFARRQPLHPQRVDINELVEGVVTLLRRVLGADIEISLDLGRDLSAVKVDPALLEAVLTNIANNARDAMPNGGRLVISTAMRCLDPDYAGDHSEVTAGEYVAIEISDTGIGMSAAVMAHIFEPFFTTKERDRGSGLGLSMVFGFLKQSGGHISVYSEEGVGTTFRLYLPRTTEPLDTKERAARAVASDRGNDELILVVEDNLALRRVAVRQLTELGYRIVEAGTTQEALTIIESGTVDLVFTDVVLPGGMDGFELARIVGEHRPDMKIVLTSGFPEAKLEPALALTKLRLLSKPYRKEDLARALHDALAA
jgi:PAS domain S-box-containing protein